MTEFTSVLYLQLLYLECALCEIGILDAEDKNGEEEDNDEVLAELKKKQQELKVLSQHNMMITKRLCKMAKEEMQRQELRKKMAAADADVSIFISESPSFSFLLVIMSIEAILSSCQDD